MRRAIFVIDDNALTRALVTDALLDLGYEPIPCSSAEEALAAVMQDVPAACIVDQVMPNMSGADFIRALRDSRDARVRALPVVGLTAGGEKELISAGATACVKKPFAPASFSPVIDAALAVTRGTTSPRDAARLTPTLAQLHDRARQGLLTRHERVLYETMRDDLARTMLVIQQVSPPREAQSRRALRVRMSVPVKLVTGPDVIETSTNDIGPGGFCVTLQGSSLRCGDEAQFELMAASPRRVVGHARVASTAREAMGLGRRVGFQFINVRPDDAERIAILVFDTLIAGIERAGLQHA